LLLLLLLVVLVVVVVVVVQHCLLAGAGTLLFTAGAGATFVSCCWCGIPLYC
jgi:hypothetical protein